MTDESNNRIINRMISEATNAVKFPLRVDISEIKSFDDPVVKSSESILPYTTTVLVPETDVVLANLSEEKLKELEALIDKQFGQGELIHNPIVDLKPFVDDSGDHRLTCLIKEDNLI